MEQRCTLLNIWLTWLGLPALALAVGVWRGWLAAVVVLVAGVAAELVYLRIFPSISHLLGYGSVADRQPAPGEKPATVTAVVLYTANVCPFCPIVRRRLERLQAEMEFRLEEIDLTFRPQLARAKGLRSVPVVEAGGRCLRGNATSSQLTAFLTEGAADAPTA